ncbi:hypothetical protein OG203_17375 [Nocardia sp. NBC_01499]|uniref:DUF6630 family protein n=1 Tax=Nocardia sp. NBC_01499 TaxID=2903597 RepID=UPI0038665800
MSPENVREALVLAAGVLVPDQPSVGEGIRAVTDGDPRSALIRMLTERGAVAVFDWEEDPKQIRSLLEALPSYPANLSWGWYDRYELEVDDLDQSEVVERFLEVVGERCSRVGGVLLSIDTGGDDYAVMFMVAEDYTRLSALRVGGFEAVRLGQWSGIDDDIVD